MRCAVMSRAGQVLANGRLLLQFFAVWGMSDVTLNITR